MKKHDINMIAAWARDWGLSGYEHLDPKVRVQRQYASAKKQRERKEYERSRYGKNEKI